MRDRRITTLLSFSFPDRLQTLPLVGARPGPLNSAGVAALSGLAKKAALHVDQGCTPETLELKRKAPLPRDIWLKHAEASWRSSSHYTSILAHQKLELWRSKDKTHWPGSRLATVSFVRLCYLFSKCKSTSSSLRQTLLLPTLSGITTAIAS